MPEYPQVVIYRSQSDDDFQAMNFSTHTDCQLSLATYKVLFTVLFVRSAYLERPWVWSPRELPVPRPRHTICATPSHLVWRHQQLLPRHYPLCPLIIWFSTIGVQVSVPLAKLTQESFVSLHHRASSAAYVASAFSSREPPPVPHVFLPLFSQFPFNYFQFSFYQVLKSCLVFPGGIFNQV